MSNNNVLMANTILANDIYANNVMTNFLQAQKIETENIRFNGTVIDLNLIPNYDPGSITPYLNGSGWVYGYSVSNKSFTLDDNQSGMLIGNGKIAMLSSFDTIDVQRTYITTDIQYTQGMFRPNVIETFSVANLKFFHNDATKTQLSVQSQEIDMYGAIFTSTYLASDLDPVGAYVQADVSLYAPRNHPFSIMQTVTIRESSVPDVPFFHEVYCGQNLRDVDYNNGIIYNEAINDEKGVYVLSGKGYTTEGRQVAFASCYLFENRDDVENLGFNVYRLDTRRCYNKFKLKNVDIYAPIKFHIFSTLITDYDFVSPLEEVKRIVLSVAYRGATPALSASRVRSDHVILWQNMWKTNITIAPKAGISAGLESDLEHKNLLIKTALYNIYSSIRENVSLEINPACLSVIDQIGQVLYDGDMWTLPVLIMLKPDVARSMLEYRFKSMNMAQQIAAAYGYAGAKFPYLDDTLGYKNAMYWNVLSPMHVFNNGFIAVNIWNYYRVTRDKDWLITKGYPMLKGIADFFVSIIEIDEVTGEAQLRKTVGLTGNESADNNSFTNNLARLALRYALESSYELGYAVRTEWRTAYFNLPLLYVDQMYNHDVIKFDEAALGTDTYTVAEALYVLMPWISQIYFCSDQLHSAQSIKRNIDYYTPRVESGEVNNPLNIAILAILHGLYAQYNETHVVDFQNHLNDFIWEHVTGIWNHMPTYKASRLPAVNNIVMNSMFILVLLQAIPQLNIVGGVSETRFYYEEMKLKALVSANMPSHWANVKVSQVGRDKKTYITRNSLAYITNP